MKKNIALLTGGDSSEYEIALQGADLVEQNIDRNKYDVYRIVVRNGHWRYTAPEGEVQELDRNDFSLMIGGRRIRLDYAYILIHGTPGEDGRLQGYLDMMHVPYSSSGFIPSVVTFDKAACKRAVAGTGINLAREILLAPHDPIDPQRIIETLGLPLFVKPNASGSSFGVTKVKSPEELAPAVAKAFTESDRVLIEEFIEGREISCGVMVAGGKEYLFPITELVLETEFFDYDAKYKGKSLEITPARLDERIRRTVNAMTLSAYKTLGCRGIARVDFIIKDETPYLIEINTIPGMTPASFIPQQAKAMNMSIAQLLETVIEDTIQTVSRP